MLYSFKQKSQDFIVEEQLPFKLAGQGEAFFVYFEKRNLNTMDVVKHLCKELGISRLTLGIAGLKDKDAITRQWISIYQRALKKLWGEKVFIRALEEVARVVETNWHTQPMGMTQPVSNLFHIRLRAQQAVWQEDKKKIQQQVTTLLKKWFPNFFGEQRFGVNFQNIKMGKEIIEWKLRLKEKFERKFKLQSYSSYLFNEYLKVRLQTKRLGHLEDWEMGPVFGDDIQLSDPKSKIGQFEKRFMNEYDVNNQFFDAYKKHWIYGIKRPLWVNPKQIEFRFQGDDILLDFELPWGTYASILVEELLKIVQ